MAKTTTQKEAAALYHREQQELEEQECNRSMLYYIWKQLRDVGDTGDEQLDAIRDTMYDICKEVPYLVSQFEDKN